MACNSCAKQFSLLRKEKGCPGCGFSYCTNCLNNKVFVPKLNAEAKVCAKCRQCPSSNEKKQIIPPDAYYKRMAALGPETSKTSENYKDQEILQRLQNLKKGSTEVVSSGKVTEEEIVGRLQTIKGEVPSVSDEELHMRLAKLRGHPSTVASNKPALPAPDVRTQEEQINDLLNTYLEETKIDSKYKNEYNEIINEIESRVHKLKSTSLPQPSTESQQNDESEDEEETVQKIIQKVKAESLLDDNTVSHQTINDELPFCEICNEDAVMRCLGCKYLFCKRCFMEHRDDDDGCDRYELYKPEK